MPHGITSLEGHRKAYEPSPITADMLWGYERGSLEGGECQSGEIRKEKLFARSKGPKIEHLSQGQAL